MRIGLLGGSFNPAHEGHRHVADHARRRLRLDQVWLLISPGNVLKPQAGMAGYEHRLAGTARIADGRRVLAAGLEAAWGTRFSYDTVRMLRRRFPRARFVWVMGADILAELPRWRHWMRLARAIPFLVLPRPSYNARALAGQAARRMRHARLAPRAARLLAGRAPGWVFLPASQHAASASAIRAAAKGDVP